MIDEGRSGTSRGRRPERPQPFGRPFRARSLTLLLIAITGNQATEMQSAQVDANKRSEQRKRTRGMGEEAMKWLPHRRPSPQGCVAPLRSRAAHALAPPGRDAPRGRGLPEQQGG